MLLQAVVYSYSTMVMTIKTAQSFISGRIWILQWVFRESFLPISSVGNCNNKSKRLSSMGWCIFGTKMFATRNMFAKNCTEDIFVADKYRRGSTVPKLGFTAQFTQSLFPYFHYFVLRFNRTETRFLRYCRLHIVEFSQYFKLILLMLKV